MPQFVSSPEELPERRGRPANSHAIEDREDTLPPDIASDGLSSGEPSPYLSPYDAHSRVSRSQVPSGYFPPQSPNPHAHAPAEPADSRAHDQDERRGSETTLREDDLSDGIHLYNPFDSHAKKGEEAYDEDDQRVSKEKKSDSGTFVGAPHLGYNSDAKTQPSGKVEDEGSEVDSDGDEDLKHSDTKKHPTIRFNPCAVEDRKMFVVTLARAMLVFGAPAHRIEAQLKAVARTLEVTAQFIHIPGMMICAFRDRRTRNGETHFVSNPTGLSLGKLHDTHTIYRLVSHDEISAVEGTKRLQDLLDSPPTYPVWAHHLFAFLSAGFICPMAFGGSFLDMWPSAFMALALSLLQRRVAISNMIHSSVFEITVAGIFSFIARGIASIHHDNGRTRLFCYSAVSSSSIIAILPGWLILISGLELASKKILSGSVHLVYALIFALFLGFGLQIGSDIFLAFRPSERDHLRNLAQPAVSELNFAGTFTSFDKDSVYENMTGSWAFQALNEQAVTSEIIGNCHRPRGNPWWLRPLPPATLLFFVPVVALLSSLQNEQPWRTRDMPVMVVISCAAFVVSYYTGRVLQDKPDVVAALCALVIGIAGNIWSRAFKGTAYTVMVTGVLFLVPNVFAETGGITADGSGIDIGGKILEVTVGTTVGLFVAQAGVYLLGEKKNAAAWSF